MVCVRAGVAVRVALALSLSGAALVPGAAGAADITVILDQAKVLKLPDRVTTLVIGNPLIADAAIQSGGQLVVTGKGYGLTNIIALDRAGNALMDKSIEVVGPRGVVVVYRGIERETYSCSPKCERQITLGDSNSYFDATIAETAARNGLAQGGSAAAPK
jgi:Pilus formation protein N terminal region